MNGLGEHVVRKMGPQRVPVRARGREAGMGCAVMSDELDKACSGMKRLVADVIEFSPLLIRARNGVADLVRAPSGTQNKVLLRGNDPRRDLSLSNPCSQPPNNLSFWRRRERTS